MSDNSDKWYKAGLKFSCTQCGNCCTGDPGVVWVDDEELNDIAEFLDVSIGEAKLNYTRLFGRKLSLKEYANGDCVFFDPSTRQCKVYDDRPRQCRSWPFWDSNIRTPQRWADTCAICPGSGKGPLIPLDEIERQRTTIPI